jgi:hypothetical protein
MHITLKFTFGIELHVSDRFSVRPQKSSTVYAAIGICHTGYADCLLARSGFRSYITMHGPLNVKIFLILYIFFYWDREVYFIICGVAEK